MIINIGERTAKYAIALMVALMHLCINEVSSQTAPTDTLSTSDTITAEEWRYALSPSVYQAISQCNVVALSTAFSTSIELSTPTGSGVYSRKQAEVILNEFFTGLANQSYNIDHEMSVSDATLTIGTLISNKLNYRIYILTKNINGLSIIQQLRIEEQND